MPITGLVEMYRNQYTPAATVLLEKFRPYLLKWVRLLIYGKWDHKDKEIKHFLSMMGNKNVEGIAPILSLQLSSYESVDIEQEIRLVFLETILNTRSIRKYFRYALQRRVVKLLRDPLVYYHNKQIPVSNLIVSAPDATEIDDTWVAGFTCGDGFIDLTIDERRVIQLHHYFGYTIEQTAVTMNVSPSTINRMLRNIRSTLSGYYLSKNHKT